MSLKFTIWEEGVKLEYPACSRFFVNKMELARYFSVVPRSEVEMEQDFTLLVKNGRSLYNPILRIA